MPLRAALFDLDGTLLDTLADIHAAVNVALGAVGLPPRPLAEVRAFVGDGADVLMARACGAGAAPAVRAAALAAYTAHYGAHNAETTAPYPGVPELLAALRARGLRLGVVSNKPQADSAAVVAHYFPGAFDVVIGARPDLPKKPAPDPLLAALRALECAPADAVYLGDSANDVRAPLAAGVPAYAALWGFRSRAELAAAGATRFVPSPAAFLSALGR